MAANGAGSGVAAVQSATLGPLADGARASGLVCAWTAVCTTLTAVGVGPELLEVGFVGGTPQTASVSGMLAAVTLQVTDGAGHGVAGASVEVFQTVSQWQPGCPVTGRCPSMAVYSSAATAAVSDVDGMVTVLPAQIAGTATITEIAVVAGSSGFTTTTLLKQP